MAIIFEWDSVETVKRKFRTVQIHRRLVGIEKESILNDGVLTKELELEKVSLEKELKVINLELSHKWMYEDDNI